MAGRRLDPRHEQLLQAGMQPAVAVAVAVSHFSDHICVPPVVVVAVVVVVAAAAAAAAAAAVAESRLLTRLDGFGAGFADGTPPRPPVVDGNCC
jgi:hypothetical protein